MFISDLLFFVLLSVATMTRVVQTEMPHIVFITVSDLGWNDVGFHGSNQIPTPNIDALAYNGIILNSHYVQAQSTPTRAALFTGKYPMRLGMHGPSIQPAESRSLPEGKILPEYFKNLGYSTYLIGKWHLGYDRWNSTPTNRGFDHHLGFYNEYVSYYDYLNTIKVNDKDYTGFDMRRQSEPAWDLAGQYATDLFTDYAINRIESHDATRPLFMMISHTAPHCGNEGKRLEAPQEAVNKLRHIADSNRRTYAAMVTKVDESVGRVFSALDQKGMLQNSVVVFMSDNGAPSTVGPDRNWGSNYPLRGVKSTLFEGGVRSAALVWSPALVSSGRVYTDLFHVSDWLPTLFAAAEGDISLLDPDLDGIDQWSSLVYQVGSPRNDILLNIDESTRNAGLRFSNWKLIVGTTNNGSYDSYFGDSGEENVDEVVNYNTSAISESPVGRIVQKLSYTPVSEPEYLILRREATLKCLSGKVEKNPCNPAVGEVCLYDIQSDPCEEKNLATYFPSVVRRMKRALVDYRAGLSPQLNREPEIEKADPKLFKFAWNPWLDCSDLKCTS